ncbi:MAG: serine/threonine-protein kinase [Chloroflexi bacterium]|nr:serine/threonine-protein kinase [Chloroflexota bacterium]
MTLNAGDDFAGYEIITRIGAGGMATVYQAYHERLDRHVAIKVMHDTFVQDGTFLERFQREARIVGRLEHPHIVPVYDYDEFEGQPYFVMKYIEGGTLKRRLIKRGITLDKIKSVMTMLADALTYAHEKGVLHRDIKPSNILIDERDLSYISDFGLARIVQVGDSTISHDMMLGTPFYISPEQARGERNLSPATDVYSFGIILYELLVGQVPFIADNSYAIVHEHIYTAPRPPSQSNPDLNAGVDEVLLKALAKEPSERYQTATALMDDFKLALAESGLKQLPPDRSRVQQGPGPRSYSRPHLDSAGVARDQQLRHLNDDQLADFAELATLEHRIKRKVGLRKRKGGAKSRGAAIRERVEKKFRARRAIIIHLLIYTLIIGTIAVGVIFQGRVTDIQDLVMFASFWGIFPALQAVRFHYKYGRGADNRREETERVIARDSQSADMDGEEEWQVRKRIEKKYAARRGIAYLASLFAIVNSAWILNMIFVPGYWRWGANHIPSAVFWGFVLFLLCLRYYFIHGRGATKLEAEIEGEITRELRLSEMRERERLKRLHDDDHLEFALDNVNMAGVRLNDEGELTDSFVEEAASGRSRQSVE